MSLLRLSNLQLSYRLEGRLLPVLSRVDLDVGRGEMVAILGPSGSGKSTLLYILGCLLKPTSGSFLFAGREVVQLSGEDLADLRSQAIGFVFQQFHLLPRADVLENVMLGARYNRQDTRSPDEVREQALALIDRVGLTEHTHHHPNQLSGGQQQRVAIARALINNPPLILADEPTGNLDSKSAGQVLDMLEEVHRSGHTVILITHDAEVAKRCERVVSIHDGVLSAAQNLKPLPGGGAKAKDPGTPARRDEEPWFDTQHLAGAWQNLMRNKGRSVLTMLGVTIGIAAVLSTVTLGSYTRAKILEGYESLGTNKLVMRAYPNWRMRAKDHSLANFEGVDQKNDVLPMRRLFTEIQMISPVVQDWISSVEFGGRSQDQVAGLGVTAEYFEITNRKIALGRKFSHYHIDNHSRVCVIGYDIATKLFSNTTPLNQILQINGNNSVQYSCLIIGVLAPQTSNSEWNKPNLQVLMPESYLSLMAARWNSKPNEFDMRIRAGASAEELGSKIKRFFHLKYGNSVMVNVDEDQLLVEQMRRFLNLFAMLLAGVAFISLAVGGIGITNMMLVSVTERIKEIGLRKALGARDTQIHRQLLAESIILCVIAGFMGIVGGVVGYHGILYLASQLFPKVHFEWIFNFPAILLSTVCILLVGVASGIVPALRAQKLEVVHALRNE